MPTISLPKDQQRLWAVAIIVVLVVAASASQTTSTLLAVLLGGMAVIAILKATSP